MKKYINKYSISFFAMFSIMIFCISCLISTIFTVQKDMRIDNYLLNEDSMVLSLNNIQGYGEDLLNNIFNQKDVLIKGVNLTTDDKKIKGTMMWFNYDLETVYPMIEGEFFTVEECINKVPIAVVGKNTIDNTYIKNDQRYILIEGQEYLIKGIMGEEKRNLSCDNLFIINSSAYFEKNGNSKNINVHIISAFKETNTAMNNIINKIKNISPDININKMSNVQFQGENVLFAQYSLPLIIKSIIAIFLINIVIVNVFWLISRKKELAIKKMLGATTLEITLSTLIYQQVIIIFAYIFAITVHYVIATYSYLPILDYVGTQISFISTLQTLFYSMIIGIVITIPLIIKINKIEPALSVKRG